MRKQIFSILFCLLYFPAVSQPNARGAQSQALPQAETGTVRALIIGISEYKEIEPLQYADKDALAFCNYLKSKAGGAVPASNIMMLLNSEANIGNIVSALEWLKQDSKPSDKVIIYFSGHGDVETLTDAQNGYLLTYNSRKKVYVAGALPVHLLKDYISTLGNKKVSSVLIIDACRSGKLAGGQEGARMTSTALLNQWNNEIKIMSCQPGQFSLEGKEWGGGRGAFSYHLIDGLNGLADKNHDNEISLAELESYVAEKVSIETQKLQEPIFEGKSKFSTRMALVDSTTLATLQNEKARGTVAPMIAGMKAVSLVINDDSVSVAYYNAMMDAVVKGRLINPTDSSASFFFTKLEKNKPDAQLTRIARRNLTAALLNDVQDMFNQYLDGKKFLRPDSLKEAGRELELTMSLLGEQHPLHKSCLARKYFIEAAAITSLFAEEDMNDSLLNAGLSLLKLAENSEPGAAYIFLSKGELYLKARRFDEAEQELLKARDASPSWVMPYYVLGWVYSQQKKSAESIQAWEKAISLDSTMKSFECTKCIFLHIGEMYDYKGNSRKALEYYGKALKADSSFSSAYLNSYISVLGNIKIRDLLALEKKIKQAEKYIYLGMPYFTKNELHTVFGMSYYLRLQTSLGKNARKENFDSCVFHLNEAYNADSTDVSVLCMLGDVYNLRGLPDEAMEYYYQALKIDSLDPEIYFGLAEINFDLGEYSEALDWLEQASQKVNYDSIYLSEILFLKAEVLLNQKTYSSSPEPISDDDVLDVLEEALKAGFEDKSYVKSVFSPMKKNKRYQSLLRQYFTERKT